jgi:hypothetical protein
MLFHDGRVKRPCAYCGQFFRPRVADQKWCRPWCKARAKAHEGRSARRAWWAAGRPMFGETEVNQREEQQA